MAAIVNMKSLKQDRQDRAAMERQAASLFRRLLKSERGCAGPGAHLTPPGEREAMARRVKAIEAEILKIRRQIRRIGAGR